MMQNKKVIGVTGGSGSGKSTFCRFLKKKGYYIIDADAIGHKVILFNQPAYKEILNYFGEDILNDDNEIDRKKLSKIVFGNKKKLEILNSITHKYINTEIKNKIAECSEEYIFLDAAVLINSELIDMCDSIIVVTAPIEQRADRIALRDAITIQAAMNRIHSQPSDDEYMKLADYIIHNDGNIDNLFKDMENVLEEVLSEKDS